MGREAARAIQRFEDRIEPGEARLIDNIEANVRAWEERGGVGYVFVSDAQFAVDRRQFYKK